MDPDIRLHKLRDIILMVCLWYPSKSTRGIKKIIDILVISYSNRYAYRYEWKKNILWIFWFSASKKIREISEILLNFPGYFSTKKGQISASHFRRTIFWTMIKSKLTQNSTPSHKIEPKTVSPRSLHPFRYLFTI